MDTPLLEIGAATATLLSALALYAGGRHCRWRWLARLLGRTGTPAGLALAGLALSLWVRSLGVGAGLCVMLASWMIASMAIPTLAVLLDPQAPVARR